MEWSCEVFSFAFFSQCYFLHFFSRIYTNKLNFAMNYVTARIINIFSLLSLRYISHIFCFDIVQGYFHLFNFGYLQISLVISQLFARICSVTSQEIDQRDKYNQLDRFHSLAKYITGYCYLYIRYCFLIGLGRQTNRQTNFKQF